MAVFVKLKSANDYTRIPIDNPSVTVAELKDLVFTAYKFPRTGDFDLHFQDAQSQHSYVSDHERVPRDSSVLIFRKQKASGSLSKAARYAQQAKAREGPIRATGSIGGELSEEASVMEALRKAKENRKIQPARPGPAHAVQETPDGKVQQVLSVHGIPKSKLMIVDDPETPGAMPIGDGKYAVIKPDVDRLKEDVFEVEEESKEESTKVSDVSNSFDVDDEDESEMALGSPKLSAFKLNLSGLPNSSSRSTPVATSVEPELQASDAFRLPDTLKTSEEDLTKPMLKEAEADKKMPLTTPDELALTKSSENSLPSQSSSSEESVKLNQSVPETESKERVPETESKEHVPETESKDRVPETESKERVPESESKEHVPESESKQRSITAPQQYDDSKTSASSGLPSTVGASKNIEIIESGPPPQRSVNPWQSAPPAAFRGPHASSGFSNVPNFPMSGMAIGNPMAQNMPFMYPQPGMGHPMSMPGMPGAGMMGMQGNMGPMQMGGGRGMMMPWTGQDMMQYAMRNGLPYANLQGMPWIPAGSGPRHRPYGRPYGEKRRRSISRSRSPRDRKRYRDSRSPRRSSRERDDGRSPRASVERDVDERRRSRSPRRRVSPRRQGYDSNRSPRRGRTNGEHSRRDYRDEEPYSRRRSPRRGSPRNGPSRRVPDDRRRDDARITVSAHKNDRTRSTQERSRSRQRDRSSSPVENIGKKRAYSNERAADQSRNGADSIQKRRQNDRIDDTERTEQRNSDRSQNSSDSRSARRTGSSNDSDHHDRVHSERTTNSQQHVYNSIKNNHANDRIERKGNDKRKDVDQTGNRPVKKEDETRGVGQHGNGTARREPAHDRQTHKAAPSSAQRDKSKEGGNGKATDSNDGKSHRNGDRQRSSNNGSKSNGSKEGSSHPEKKTVFERLGLPLVRGGRSKKDNER